MTRHVRWKDHGDEHWSYGRLIGTERDESVRIYAESNGGARSIQRHRVQVEVRGPRGGKSWEELKT